MSVNPSEAAMMVAVVDAVGGEGGVVGASVPGQALDQLVAHRDRQLPAGDLAAAEPVLLLAVQGGEVHQLVGHLVVVLQGVDERHRLHSHGPRLVQGQPQELRVPGGHGVVVGRSGDEVVGQVGAPLLGVADVVDGEVELLEGEPADLAHHAGDQLVGRL
jgi:hypothetical protein